MALRAREGLPPSKAKTTKDPESLINLLIDRTITGFKSFAEFFLLSNSILMIELLLSRGLTNDSLCLTRAQSTACHMKNVTYD